MIPRVPSLSFQLLAMIWLVANTTRVTADESVAQWESPVISGYGYFNPLPESKLRPDPHERYKVVFDVTTRVDSPGAVNPGLLHVARAINLFGHDGKPDKNLEVVVIIHGPATRAVLNDNAYRARFSSANPNDDLIKKLKAAGAALYVCGQAIVDSGYYYQNVRNDIEVVLAAVAAEIVLVTKGYVLIKL
jgi:intracellular sulfur oxidation DsrE/DsrF family protein